MLVLSLALGACGDSSAGNTATAAGGQARGPFASLTSDQRTCLRKEGVSLPTFRQRQGPPPGANGQPPPGGQPPAGMQRRFTPNSAQAKKMRAAFKKCGITIPSPPQAAQN